MPFFFNKGRFVFYFLFLGVLVSLAYTGPVCAQAPAVVNKIKKVMIDPGHGGKDPGTISKKYKEKDIVLAVSLEFGRLIKEAYPDVEVLYTRNKDVFIPLDERGNMANKQGADLFISVHVNANDSRKPSGSETYVMGLEMTKGNMNVAMRENSVIKFEDDYTSKYEGYDPNSPESFILFSLMQNTYLEQSLELASLIQDAMGKEPIKINRGVKQERFLVLWKTAMPSVLVELGFLSNVEEEKILADKKKQAELAKNLFNGFTKYKNKFEAKSKVLPAKEVTIPLNDKVDTKPLTGKDNKSSTASTPKAANKKTESYFAVQIMSSGNVIKTDSKQLKGLKGVKVNKVGSLYKCTVGEYKTYEEAIKSRDELKQKGFKDAFIVTLSK